jgi:PAS domain S-box-containing protein
MQTLMMASWAASIMPPVLVTIALVAAFVVWGYYADRRKRRALAVSMEEANSTDTEDTQDRLASAAYHAGLFAALHPTSDLGSESLPSRFPIGAQLRSYGLVVLMVCVALAARLALEPELKGQIAFGFFFVPVFLSAWMAGVSETLLALILGFMAAEWFIIEPRGTFMISGTNGWVSALIYFFIGLGILWFMQSERIEGMRALSSDLASLKRLKELEEEKALHEDTRTLCQALLNLVDTTKNALLTFTAQGRILTWNAAMEKLLGLSAAEVLGRPFTMVFPPERRGEAQLILEQVARGEQTENWPAVLAGKDGNARDAVLTATPLSNAAGKFLGASVIVRLTSATLPSHSLHYEHKLVTPTIAPGSGP